MFRALFVPLLAVSVVATAGGCRSSGSSDANKDKGSEESGGSGGTAGVMMTGAAGDHGGSGGQGGDRSADAGATGGAGGTGGLAGAGGTEAVGGAGGVTTSQRDASADHSDPPGTDGGPISDARDAGNKDLGGKLATHPWVIPCDPSWSLAQCCMHYCTCMMTNCPTTIPKNCQETCTTPKNGWNLKCRVEQCFQSLNPNYPQDHGSHCGHAAATPAYGAKCEGIIP